MQHTHHLAGCSRAVLSCSAQQTFGAPKFHVCALPIAHQSRPILVWPSNAVHLLLSSSELNLRFLFFGSVLALNSKIPCDKHTETRERAATGVDFGNVTISRQIFAKLKSKLIPVSFAVQFVRNAGTARAELKSRVLKQQLARHVASATPRLQ